MADSRLAQLRELLQAYRPFDEIEAGYRASMLGLLDTGQDALSGDHFLPGHFTASGFVVSPDRVSLLLVHHARLERWLQPGGHVEHDDVNLEDAARREVLEETAVAELDTIGLFDLDIHRFPERGQDPAHDHLDIRFGFVAASDLVKAGEGTTDVRWFPLAEVADWQDRPSLSRPALKLLRGLSSQ